ncbi:hypothetical protein JCM5353_007426 [Sporobolomyces roseus]
MVRPAQQQQLKTVVAAIGLSSPETRWSTLHMSYSLTYHLVESELAHKPPHSLQPRAYYHGPSVALDNTGGMELDGLNYGNLLHQFQYASGRIAGLGEKEELFILAQMAVGCYLTNHSAIFANATTCPLFEDLDTALDSSKSISRLGATRQEALASILDQINLQIERQLRLPLETPGDVVEYLTIWHLALVHCGGSQSIATIRLKLLQAVMHRGVSKFREYEPLLEATALIRSALCPIAQEEIHQALALGQDTSM